jgi:YrbI family 3-deoxy-D-manno-octulosonate 8-phosphate phosphatase
LAHLQKEGGYRPELVVFLQPTSPLRQHDDVQNAIDTLISSKADSLFSACVQEGFVWRYDGNGLSPITYDYRARPRRQDAPQDLAENGSIYVFKPWVLEELGNRLGGRIAVYRMSVYDSFQIDEPDDLDLMEALFAFRPVRSMPDVRRVELLAMDFDGVMTDNRVLVDQDGREAVWANRSDGLGVARLREAGVQAMVISTEVNPVVAARCDKLGVDVLHGCEDKLAALQQAAQQHELTAPAIAYVGNDLNDIECLQWVGAAFAVADAAPEVQAIADFVTRAPGGHGAIREVCDIILAQRGSRNG